MNLRNIKITKPTAAMLLLVMLWQLVYPVSALALTSGPSQPEMQSFEPVGTTDMVNAFSGDFTYNIPLMDVEGYPVNIAYHSGITMEQEASWVGLGWNINPGNISHGVRGIPDDFDGEKIEKEIVINDEVKKRFGMLLSIEFAGFEVSKAMQEVQKILKINIGGSASMGINISNYTGVSASLGMGGSSNLTVGGKNGWMSAGINMGATFTTDGGADLNAGFSTGVTSGKSAQNMTSSITGSFGQGYNSREGLSYTSFGVNPSFSIDGTWPAKGDNYSIKANAAPEGVGNSFVPISMRNFVPVITNASYTQSKFFQFKFGVELNSVYPHLGGNYGEDVTKFKTDGTRSAYGYMNLQHATQDDITDFTRDRDGRFNRDMQYLPSGNMTYDIYGVSGQGTGGNFRSFRNDIGTVFDPYTNSDNKASSDLAEVGVGNLFEAGWDHMNSFTGSSSGPWNAYRNKFSDKKTGSLYEPHFFKQAGELSESNEQYRTAIKGNRPLSSDDVRALVASPLETTPAMQDDYIRSKRTNLLYYFTAKEASDKCVSLQPKIENYQNTPGTANAYVPTLLPRTDANRKAYHASEFTQVLPDGQRYIYGIPAMNNKQVEYVASCDAPATDDGIVTLPANSGDYKPTGSSTIGQRFYMKSTTPAYAHSYLLSSILSPDYSDLTGDGITDDDLGNYTKFNYTRKDANYTWRTPYKTGEAQYDKGVASDCHDDKGTFIIGSKEIWMMHSIETKNYVAEFYTSERQDGLGSGDTYGLAGANVSHSYKLDSIALFNRNDRLQHTTSAVPIKKVIFTYDYSLCKGVENGPGSASGKLTLRAISIKFGNSDVGMLSPYVFNYSTKNPGYKQSEKDMWGCYKPAQANAPLALTNHEFPYVKQDKNAADENAGAWNLANIKLPSGGEINVTYEADDYAYVQNRRAMEMFKVAGIGPDENYQAGGNSLYQNPKSPYLFVYFNRKKNNAGAITEWYNDMRKSYLDNGDLVQYNFKVDIAGNGQTVPSCGIPLKDHIKGYAAVESIGVCSGNSDYGYIKLSPKTVDKMPSLHSERDDMKLNPVTLAAIFYAKYYNNKALYPESEVLSAGNGGALIKQIIASMLEISNYFRSPITKYLNDGRAKYVELDQSFIRLCSQGNKFGGGHRVKRIEFTDSWSKVAGQSAQSDASYGSEYDYTVTDAVSGKKISSGVASYEPMVGGDENPFKEPIATDRIGQKRDFPVVIPTELTVEGPIGESMYPSADVGYSKVTVTSIHKADGESAQTIQEHEFYTAKDFPVRTANTPMEVLENKEPKKFSINPNKEDIFRAAQGYSLYFNDMHGKPKMESVSVARSGGTPQRISYKKYEYFTNADQTLNNTVPALYMEPNDHYLVNGNRTLGVETDIMLDSREKIEDGRTTGFMANINTFMFGTFPVPIPSAFPKIPKSDLKTFSSIVNTKIIQQYGILKSVETFDKGATVKMTNKVFDAMTGLPLVTHVNTEVGDNEETIKYPAYWAYTGMGPAYKNIMYEEEINDNAIIVNDTFYLNTPKYSRFQPGDELLFTLDKSCVQGNNAVPTTYRLSVMDNFKALPELPNNYTCQCSAKTGAGITYNLSHTCPADHLKTPFVSYPNLYLNGSTPSTTTGTLVDNVCGFPYSDAVHYSAGTATLQDIIFPAAGTSLLPGLRDILSGSGKYPLERMTQTWNGTNGDFSGTHQDVVENYSCLTPACDYENRVYLNGHASPWRHGTQGAGEYSFTGHMSSNLSDYTGEFPGWPQINRTSKVIKVTLRVYQSVRCYGHNPSITNYSDTVKLFDIADPSIPHNAVTNNYYQTYYTFYFPYSSLSTFSCPTPSALQAALNKQQVCYSDHMVNYMTYMSQFNPGYIGSPFVPNVGYNAQYEMFEFNVNGVRTGHIERERWFFDCNAEIVTRSSQASGYHAVAALPHSRNMMSGSSTQKVFAQNDRIYKGKVKVIRSGRRNQLTEDAEQLTRLNGAQEFNHYENEEYGSVVSMNAQTFTDEAAASPAIADIATEYYNPYVTARKGNYRPLQSYVMNKKRSYSGTSDWGKGILPIVSSFWRMKNYEPFLVPMTNSAAAGWSAQSKVNLYSPWGNDLEVQDAAGNIQSILFGYGNKLPVAVVKNAHWDDALFEHFEDYDEPVNVLKFYQNNMNEQLRTAIGSGGVSIVTTDHHSGARALRTTGSLALDIPVWSSVNPVEGSTNPFRFRSGSKYIVSYWQRADQNSTPPASGKLSLNFGGPSTVSISPKTPVIDGWVLYEGEVEIPFMAGSGNVVHVNLGAVATLDDIRILPSSANMKSFVYHPVTRKLVAVLDENHMSSFFEYDQEGKLVRVKKETEKGILTLKESRSSLHSILSTATGSTTLFTQ